MTNQLRIISFTLPEKAARAAQALVIARREALLLALADDLMSYPGRPKSKESASDPVFSLRIDPGDPLSRLDPELLRPRMLREALLHLVETLDVPNVPPAPRLGALPPAALIEMIGQVQALAPVLRQANEQAIRESVLTPLFAAIGWPMHDTEACRVEEPCGRGRVDYALMSPAGDRALLLIEAKRSQQLNATAVTQLARYARRMRPLKAVLTDGMHYWVYPVMDGELREGVAISLLRDAPEHVAQYVHQHLSRDALVDVLETVLIANKG